MRKKSYRPYIILGIVLVALFYVPKGIVEGLRSISAAFSWSPTPTASEWDVIRTEVLLLKTQNEKLRRQILSEDRINQRIHLVKELQSIDEEKATDFHKRRLKAAEILLEKMLYAQYAEVIHRDRLHWNSIFWINLGEGDVEVNSPVLKGENLVGIVEFVGKNKSRVRLITDSTLVPSVRVARKEEYLAKGELVGCQSPLWRGCSEFVKGVGFNYDFSDEEGPARELRSGKPLDQLTKEEPVSLIEEGDLLVTTGMDGVFPKDIPVAVVTEIETLKEGSTSVELTARLCAGNFDQLEDVTVLPPINKREG